MNMGCWLAGSCCWANSRLLLNTVQGLSMQMRTECLDSADNVGGRIVRFPLLIHGWLNWTPRRCFWISHSPRRKCEIPWTRICYRSCLGKTWVAATLLEGLTADLPLAGLDIDRIAASLQDATLSTVCEWVQSGVVPAWSDYAGLSPELRCWRLQIGKWIRREDCGVPGLLRRGLLSSWCQAGSGRT